MFKKWIVTTIMIMSAILVTANHLSSLPVVVAETTGDDDDVDGEFEITGFNNPLSIVEFQRLADNKTGNIYNIDNSQAFNPTEDLRFKLKLRDKDTMNDLHYVEFVFHHVPSGSSITQSFVNATRTTSDGSAAVFRHNISDAFITFIEPDGSLTANTSDKSKTEWGWDPSDLNTDKAQLILPVAGVTESSVTNDENPGIGTVSIDTVDAENNTVGSIEFSYQLSIQISRVANFAEGENTTSGAWYLGVRIKDGRTPNNSSPSIITVPALAISSTDPVNEPSTPFTMNWYGEVDVDGSPLDWGGNLTPGAIDMTTESGLYLKQRTYTFWSNDSHEITIKSSPTWDTSSPLAKGVTQASIVSTSTLTAPQTFAVRVAEKDEGFDNSEFLSTNELTLRAPSETSATDEAGIILRIEAWLGLAEDFQNGTYTGTITFTIKNP